jgi:hypothetical protein
MNASAGPKRDSALSLLVGCDHRAMDAPMNAGPAGFDPDAIAAPSAEILEPGGGAGRWRGREREGGRKGEVSSARRWRSAANRRRLCGGSGGGAGTVARAARTCASVAQCGQPDPRVVQSHLKSGRSPSHARRQSGQSQRASMSPSTRTQAVARTAQRVGMRAARATAASHPGGSGPRPWRDPCAMNIFIVG